jgi:hypothetical protein
MSRHVKKAYPQEINGIGTRGNRWLRHHIRENLAFQSWKANGERYVKAQYYAIKTIKSLITLWFEIRLIVRENTRYCLFSVYNRRSANEQSSSIWWAITYASSQQIRRSYCCAHDVGLKSLIQDLSAQASIQHVSPKTSWMIPDMIWFVEIQFFVARPHWAWMEMNRLHIFNLHG